MRLCISLIVAIVAIQALPCGAAAASIYSVYHNADAYGQTGPIETVGPQGTPIDYDFGYQGTYVAAANFGEVRADVNPGAIGIYARTINLGGYAVQRQEVTASYTFDALFSSPTNDPISVILNLDLSGQIQAATGGGTVQVFVGTANQAGIQRSLGTYDRNNGVITKDGMLSSFVDSGTKRTVSTGTFVQVPVNVPTGFEITLKTTQGYFPWENHVISFGNTLNLTTLGDVFTILGPNAAAVRVDSVDAGIVDNRFGRVSGVPEPSSITLLGLGGVGLLGLGWRRRSNRSGGRDANRS